MPARVYFVVHTHHSENQAVCKPRYAAPHAWPGFLVNRGSPGQLVLDYLWTKTLFSPKAATLFVDYKMYSEEDVTYYGSMIWSYLRIPQSFMFREKICPLTRSLGNHRTPLAVPVPAWHRSMPIRRAKPAIITVYSIKPWQQKLVWDTTCKSFHTYQCTHQLLIFEYRYIYWLLVTSPKWAWHAYICKPT